LLDPVAPANAARFAQLAKDHDGQRGRETNDSRCEARLALTLETQGILSPTVVRPPWGEAEDGDGQIWDFKAPHSRAAIAHRIATKAALSGQAPPPIPAGGYAGEFEVNDEITRAIGQQQIGKGVVFDLRRLSVAEARALIAAVDAEPRIDPELIRFFPKREDLQNFNGGGAHGN
jgi:hypothetical protein